MIPGKFWMFILALILIFMHGGDGDGSPRMAFPWSVFDRADRSCKQLSETMMMMDRLIKLVVSN